MNNLPLVSILIPTYNQPEFFRQALESALAQDYPNIEILVSDDSTNDRVQKVFNEYKNCGRNLKYLKHGGYTDESVGERSLLNMENLLEHANGEFVNILFHDDLIYPRKISTMMQFFTSNMGNQIAIVSSSRDVIDTQGSIIKTLSDIDNFSESQDYFFLTGEEVGRIIFMIYGNFIGELSTVLIRRKDFYRDCVKKLSPGYFLGVKDRTMWDVSTYLEICKDGRGLVLIREPLSAFRLAGKNQNTFNANIRIDLLLDWLAFITIAFLKNQYLHSWKEFSLACDTWLLIVQKTVDFVQFMQSNLSCDAIDYILRATESISNKDYDVAFNIGRQVINQYSSITSQRQRCSIKNSEFRR